MDWITSIGDRLTPLTALARSLDPRVVHMREPGHGPSKRIPIAIVATTGLMIAGAAAFATTLGQEDSHVPVEESRSLVENATPYEPALNEATIENPTTPLPPSHRPAVGKPEEVARRPANFFDPIYVFTQEPAQKVTAYPLADPPGLVVNLDGLPEPEADADSMVGKDPRVKAVRMKSTSTGIRYILRLSIPIKRIETTHEGNVVIVSPVK